MVVNVVVDMSVLVLVLEVVDGVNVSSALIDNVLVTLEIETVNVVDDDVVTDAVVETLNADKGDVVEVLDKMTGVVVTILGEVAMNPDDRYGDVIVDDMLEV